MRTGESFSKTKKNKTKRETCSQATSASSLPFYSLTSLLAPDSRKFRCGLISPGMVATRLLSNASRNIDPESPRMKTLANLAEDPKKVARWYARKIENIPKVGGSASMYACMYV